MMHGIRLAALLAAFVAVSPAGAAERLLDDVFGDHMVLQRGKPVTFRGTAGAGEALDVTFAGERKRIRAERNGRWSASFKPREAGGGALTLAVQAADGREETLSDLLIGDVWLCSGQSNMNWPVSRALNPSSVIERAKHEDMRLLTVAQSMSVHAVGSLEGYPRWEQVTPDNIASFSAACYFMARNLKLAEDVPLGLIHSSWGGSKIEAWLSDAGVKASGVHEEGLDLLGLYRANPSEASAVYGQKWEAYWRRHAPAGDRGPWEADLPLGDDWKPVPAVFGDWNLYGDPATKGLIGAAWYATDIDLTAEQASGTASIALGGIDEVDVAWVNGRVVGNSFGWGTPRTYEIPEGVLHEGRNRIVVNVFNGWGMGGLIGPAETLGLTLADGARLPLASGWRYKVETKVTAAPPTVPWQSISGLTTLYNAMIAPLGAMPLKGMFWYQGESNTGNSATYESLLTALIADWRGQFGQETPFLVVQLPAFGKLNATPVEDGWAGVRDAERRVAAADPKTGLVVTIDAGDRFELHPPNKQEVGRRAALVARKLVYGDDSLDLSIDGRSPDAAILKDGGITVDFGAGGAALRVMGSATPAGFEVCGEATGSCVFTPARLEGTRVTLEVPEGMTVTRVRYAWGAAPIVNLYESNGLPVSPFEIAVTR